MLARRWTCVTGNIASRTSSLLQGQVCAARCVDLTDAIAGKRAPTVEMCDATVEQVGYQAASFAFDLAFDLRRPVKPRWPEADIDSQGKPAWMPV